MTRNGSSTTGEPDPRFSEIETYTVPLSDSIALRITSDTMPSKWKTTGLQKGLRLILNDVETVGEGVGFGVPVLFFSDRLYFSGSSRLYLNANEDLRVVRKEFCMNMVPRRAIKRIELKNRMLLGFWRYLHELYMRHRLWRFIIHLSMSRRIGVHTFFEEVDPIGIVSVTYRINSCTVQSEVDVSRARADQLKKVFVLNEHGTSYFRRYTDSAGRDLIDGQIGAWETVEADLAAITDISGRIGFRTTKLENGVMRRGREFLKGSQDWIGLDYEIDPRKKMLEYEIEIMGV